MLLCTYTVSQCIQMLAIHSQMYATFSYFHVHTAINILRCFGHPREHNFGLVLILSPTGCTEGCVYFHQSCRNTHLPHFLDCLLNTTLIPCLLVCFLSILHERVCDYSGVQSSVTGILRMGDMNIHITWLTHVRTGPPKKNRYLASKVQLNIYLEANLGLVKYPEISKKMIHECVTVPGCCCSMHLLYIII